MRGDLLRWRRWSSGLVEKTTGITAVAININRFIPVVFSPYVRFKDMVYLITRTKRKTPSHTAPVVLLCGKMFLSFFFFHAHILFYRILNHDVNIYYFISPQFCKFFWPFSLPLLDLKFPFQPKKNNHGLTHVHTFAFGLHRPRNILWASQRTLEVEL